MPFFRKAYRSIEKLWLSNQHQKQSLNTCQSLGLLLGNASWSQWEWAKQASKCQWKVNRDYILRVVLRNWQIKWKTHLEIFASYLMLHSFKIFNVSSKCSEALTKGIKDSLAEFPFRLWYASETFFGSRGARHKKCFEGYRKYAKNIAKISGRLLKY